MYEDFVHCLDEEHQNDKKIVFEYPENDLDSSDPVEKNTPKPTKKVVEKPINNNEEDDFSENLTEEDIEDNENDEEVYEEPKKGNTLIAILASFFLLLLITGGVIWIVSTQEVEDISVPDVSGMTIDEAIDALEEAGFTYTTEQANSDSIEVGSVIKTKPKSGSTRKKGDTITFNNYSNIKFEVVRVTRYEDFADMLDNEDSSKAIPGVTKYKALEMYQEIYPENKEALGVYVFELQKPTNNEMKIYTLSSLINNHHKLFGKLAQSAYSVTDYICEDYPKHFEWYWSKQIPRVFNGTGEVIVCTINNNVAGVAFLKKDEEESKICTFLVVEGYRGKHIATKMLETAFKYLGTTMPLITITDYKITAQPDPCRVPYWPCRASCTDRIPQRTWAHSPRWDPARGCA